MKKRLFAFTLLTVLLLTVSAGAISARVPRISSGLSFSGDQATCSLGVYGDTGKENISATIKLMKGMTCLETWSASGAGNLNFKETASAPKGAAYKLTADVTIGGKVYPTVSTSKTNR